MNENVEVTPVSAADAMLLRRATGIPILVTRKYLLDASPVFRARLLTAARKKVENPHSAHRFLSDPIEDDPAFQKIFSAVGERVEELLKDRPKRLGLCHLHWTTRKRILAEEYGIEWFTPQQLHPGCIFD